MMKMVNNETGNKLIKLGILTAAVGLGMKYVFPIALPFLIALALARFLYPLARYLENTVRIPQAASRLLAYGIFLLAVGGIAAGMMYLIYRMGSSCLGNLDYFFQTAEELLGRCCDTMERVSGFSTQEIQRTIQKGTEGFTDGAVEYSKDAGRYMLGLLAKMLLTLIAAYLVLNDYEQIVGGMKKTKLGLYTVNLLKEMKTASWAYMKAQFSIMGMITAICILGLYVLRTPYAFWIGLAIGICDALPILGTGTVFVPWMLIEILLGGYFHALGYFIIYMVCSFVRQVLEPKLVGKRLGVPPLAVLISIYAGIWVYGGSGVILGPISALVIYELYKF